MVNHIRLVIDGHDVVLSEDTSITITKRNPYLNDGIEAFSQQFEIPIEQNRELFGSIDNVYDDTRLFSIEGKSALLYIDELLFFSGKVAPITEQQIKDNISITIMSMRQQLNDLIGDITLQDIPFPESDQADLQIGEMIGDITVDATSFSTYKVKPRLHFAKDPNPSGYYAFDWTPSFDSNNTPSADSRTIQPQALGFSTNKEYRCANTSPFAPVMNGKNLVVDKDFINTVAPYGDGIAQPDGTTRRALYHNARVSYLHHRVNDDGESTDDVLIEPSKYGPYYVLDADRPQSGICFYVLYVLEALFKYLKISYDDSALRRIEDMRRLSFYTTMCKYDLVPKYDNGHCDFPFADDFDKNGVNDWLKDRKTGGKLTQGNERSEESQDKMTLYIYPKFYLFHYGANNHDGTPQQIPDDYEHLKGGDFIADGISIYVRRSEGRLQTISKDENLGAEFIDMTDNGAGRNFVGHWVYSLKNVDVDKPTGDYRYGASVMKMIANAQNLPDMQVTSFLESLFSAFGIRFNYDSDRNHVTAYLMRDLLRTKAAPNPIFGIVREHVKMHERITGVNMKYSAESDRYEQLANIRKGVTDYDTTYDYLVEKTPEQNLITDRSFRTVQSGTLSVGDMNCYVDLQTGNAYRVKINKDALSESKMSALKPSLFEVAQGKGVTIYAREFNGMTEEQLQDPDIQDDVKELTIDFQPLIQNDLNAGRSTARGTLYSPFVGEEMWNENATMDVIRNVFESTVAMFYYIDETITTDERYDISSTDDGNSPLQSIDWGATLTLMRGGGSDARIEYFDYDYDGFGNCKYRMTSGVYAMDSDCITPHAAEYDYNGQLPGIGDSSSGSIYDREAQAEQIRGIFPRSNANLTIDSRKVSPAAVAAKGYAVDASKSHYAYLTASLAIGSQHIVFVRITDSGDILTASEAEAYLHSLSDSGGNIMDADRAQRRLIVDVYGNDLAMIVDSNVWLLNSFEDLYFADDFQPINPIDYQRISLKIRAYHLDGKGNALCTSAYAYRGLADRFMAEYIHFLLYRKKEQYDMECNAQYLLDPKWLERYSVDGNAGWLDQVETTVHATNGMESTKIDIFIL